jgi:hypothetical protein
MQQPAPKRKAGRPPRPLPEIIGLRRGDLEVVAYIGKRVSDRKNIWRCKCVRMVAGKQCGNLRVLTTSELNQPTTRCCRQCGRAILRRAEANT